MCSGHVKLDRCEPLNYVPLQLLCTDAKEAAFPPQSIRFGSGPAAAPAGAHELLTEQCSGGDDGASGRLHMPYNSSCALVNGCVPRHAELHVWGVAESFRTSQALLQQRFTT